MAGDWQRGTLKFRNPTFTFQSTLPITRKPPVGLIHLIFSLSPRTINVEATEWATRGHFPSRLQQAVNLSTDLQFLSPISNLAKTHISGRTTIFQIQQLCSIWTEKPPKLIAILSRGSYWGYEFFHILYKITHYFYKALECVITINFTFKGKPSREEWCLHCVAA